MTHSMREGSTAAGWHRFLDFSPSEGRAPRHRSECERGVVQRTPARSRLADKVNDDQVYLLLPAGPPGVPAAARRSHYRPRPRRDCNRPATAGFV